MSLTWEVHSPELGEITQLAWQPNGKVIAAAYESQKIQMFNLSDGSLIHHMTFDKRICDLRWIECDPPSDRKTNPSHSSDYFPPFDALAIFTDEVSNHQKVFQLSKTFLDPDSRLSILLVYLDGCIHLFGCGVYEIARIDTNSCDRKSFLAADLSSLYYLTTTVNKNLCLELQLHKLDTRPLSSLRRPLKHLSFHISALLHCKQILLWSLKQLKNAWENTLLELDTKLTAYARERLHASMSWSLRNELLEIILFGHISTAFQKFLSTEWTSNSIRRAGVAMLKAYESMKAITFQQLQFGLMRLIFEASEFLGFARNRYHYHPFNISEATVLRLIRDAGATLQKAQELHLVVEHCSQYLRPFFKWLYGVAVTSTKIDSDKNAQKITSQERDLIINFVTEKLRPLIVDGELKSYQIELVEQYIRNGRVTKPVDEIFGIHAQSEHFKRSKLKDLIPLPEDLESEIIPDGVFKPTNSSLADLIEETLVSHIDLIASAVWHENAPCSLLSADPKTVCLTSDLPPPSSNSPSAPLLLRVCSSTGQPTPDQLDSSSPSSLDQPGGIPVCSNKVAVVQPSNPSGAQSDSILLYMFNETDSLATVPQSVIRLNFDRFTNDDNPHNIAYRIQDLQFFGPDILVVLLYRDSLPADVDIISSPQPSSQSCSRSLQWFIFVPLDEVLKCATGSCVNVSQVVTSRRQVHPLPRKPSWFAVNGDRKTLFVMFDAICRVYIMEKFEADADVSTTVDDGSILETSPTPMSDD
ncbi:hypothetical protein AAHC03_01541 [Spirometra sp. Aus1]